MKKKKIKNIKVTEIKFSNRLIPQVESRFSPFCSGDDIRAEDLPNEVNKHIWEELKKGRSIVPVKITIQVNTTGMNIADDVADEVLAVARRTLKSVEYTNEADRGAINYNYGLLTGSKPYMFTMKVSPLSVIEALTSGYPYSVCVIGFLIRAN